MAISTGNPVRDWFTQLIANYFPNQGAPSSAGGPNTNDIINPQQILGVPLMFNKLSDPRSRVYGKGVLADSPIVTIIPGRPRFFTSPADPQTAKKDQTTIQNLLANTPAAGVSSNSTPSGINSWLQGATLARFPDKFRYYTFELDYADYFNYLSVMLNVVFIKMGMGNLTQFGQNFLARSNKAALAFYYDYMGTSVTEEASNDFGPSALEGMEKTAAGSLRELGYVFGKSQGFLSPTNAPGSQQQVGGAVEDLGKTGFFNGIMGKSLSQGWQTLENGANISLPEVWQDSKFNRNYTLAFKFHSPYGDPYSVFRFVYVPFLALMALALPKQVWAL
jgi:hypothetical protein